LKRIGFLGSDGVPTDLYKKFRGNPSESGAAMAKAIKTGYAELYQRNEYVHDLPDDEVRGLVVSATGLDAGSRLVDAICGTLKALKSFATFDGEEDDEPQSPDPPNVSLTHTPVPIQPTGERDNGIGMNLSYTINLNLPSTTDINVFNAIFTSLRENLLKR
jgi:hypothetical protein